MPTCFPAAFGVPGLFGAPQWWDNGAAPPRPYSDELYDPRWRGAVQRSFQNGSGVTGVVRGLHGVEGAAPILYLSLQVFNDPTPGANADGVRLGFQAISGDLYVLEISAYEAFGAELRAADPGDLLCHRISGGAQTTIANPTWLNDQAKAWLTIVPPAGPGLPQKYNWAVNLRIPTKTAGPDFDDAGIALGNLAGGSAFKFWLALIKDLGFGVSPYYWPRTGVEIDIDQFPQDPTVWDDGKVGSGAGCGAGISLDSYEIGTLNNDPVTGLPAPHLILVSTTAPPLNRMFTRPRNGTGGTVTAGSLSASFRTANWGSQADFTFAVGATPWEEVLPGTPKVNAAAVGPGTPPPPVPIEFNWTIPAGDAPDWIPPGGSKWRHQCMLVTLSGPYDFLNDSAYRNMDFVPTSEFERIAQISVEGIEPAPGGESHRDVYLIVDRSNLPLELDEPQRTPDLKKILEEIEGRDGEEEESPPPIGILFEGGSPPEGSPPAGSPPEGSPPEEDRPDLSVLEELAERVPTIRYQVFHTTADRIKVGRTIKPVVQEQTAFGYFIQHEGEVWGWDQVLAGDFERTQFPGIFKLRVPQGGRAVISTKVRSWEEPPPKDREPEIQPPPETGFTVAFAKHSRMVLDVERDSRRDGAPLIQWPYHGDESQRFRLEPVGSGEYRIVARHSGKVLDVERASTKDGARVVQWTWHGGDHQRFRLKPAGEGYVQIIAKHSGKVLEVRRASGQQGAEIVQDRWDGRDNQRWRLYFTPVTAKHSGLVLDIRGDSHDNGAELIQFPFHGRDDQLFQFEELDDGYYRINVAHSGKVLDVERASMENGARLVQWEWHGGDNQRFRVERVGRDHDHEHDHDHDHDHDREHGREREREDDRRRDHDREHDRGHGHGHGHGHDDDHDRDDYYRIVAKHSGKVLEVRRASREPRANVVQSEWTGAANQRWGLTLS